MKNNVYQLAHTDIIKILKTIPVLNVNLLVLVVPMLILVLVVIMVFVAQLIPIYITDNVLKIAQPDIIKMELNVPSVMNTV